MQNSLPKAKPPGLLPERHQNRDFFIANILDCAPKDDTATMEHPIFALSMNRDVREEFPGHPCFDRTARFSRSDRGQ